MKKMTVNKLKKKKKSRNAEKTKGKLKNKRKEKKTRRINKQQKNKQKRGSFFPTLHFTQVLSLYLSYILFLFLFPSLFSIFTFHYTDTFI